MEEKIIKYISDLEKEKGIKVLLACETGSRAWGFPSTDSDYDVRIIYKHHKDWYLSLIEEKDTIEVFYDNNEIDIRTEKVFLCSSCFGSLFVDSRKRGNATN